MIRNEYYYYDHLESGIITRLRSEHIGLNSYLYEKVKVADSPLCEYCEVVESVQHFLIDCRRYDIQRNKLRNRLRALNAHFWNEKHFQCVDMLMPHTWQDRPDSTDRKRKKKENEYTLKRVEILQAVVKFVLETGRFTGNIVNK